MSVLQPVRVSGSVTQAPVRHPSLGMPLGKLGVSWDVSGPGKSVDGVGVCVPLPVLG